MKKWIAIFLMVIGSTTSSFSQTTYPKKILWENDTVLAITKPQLIIINRALNYTVRLEETNKFLQMDLLVSDSIRYNLKEIIMRKDSVILFEQQKFQQSVTLIDNLQKSLMYEKKSKRNSLLRTGIVGTSIGVILGILLAK